MATREMAIAPPIFNREIKNFAQISTIVNHFTPIFWIFVGSNKKNNENHEFSHFFPEFIALSRKMNLTKTIVKVHGTLCFGQSN